MSKERPILFSGPMVRANLEGRKTQTRRVLKGAPMRLWAASGWEIEDGDCMWCDAYGDYHSLTQICPYGRIGDRLWVRETWAHRRWMIGDASPNPTTIYRADSDDLNGCDRWRPSVHMPRWASRITLEVVSVRVERLHGISEEDAVAEGVEMLPVGRDIGKQAALSFAVLWQSINGLGSWDDNPWVWVVEFKRIKP